MEKLKSTSNASKYKTFRYDHLQRWCSYWHQINETLNLNPSSILVIGVASKVVPNYLIEHDCSVTTLDIEKNFNPDVVADIQKMPFKTNSFDLVIACQVLEHLPFNKSLEALQEINRVTKKYAIISLPHWGRTFLLLLKIPMIPFIKLLYKLPSFKKNQYKSKNGHYWEIGKRKYPQKKIRRLIEKQKFIVIKEFVVFENPYHHFYILNKKR